MFCDLGGYTSWMEEDEPEEVAAVLDRFKRRAIEVLEAHGGIANQFIGDEVVGLFGVRVGHEDDPCRAVAAALALHAFVRSIQSYRPTGEVRSLRLHTGIETGVVYARVRDPRAGLYDVTGDAVNTAARLRSLASVDEILVGPAAQRRIAPFFELEQRPTEQVRGKAQPLVPHRVLGPARSSSFFEAARARGLTAYVGRDEETRWLLSAWDEARAGHGQVAIVGGAAGIGKTRLLHELRMRVAGAGREPGPLILHGRCLAYGDVAPYQPFIAVLQGWLGPTGGDPKALGERLQALDPALEASLPIYAYLLASTDARFTLPPSASGEQLRDAIIEAFAQLLFVTARVRPVLLVFEDWHWADEASRDALRIIAPRLAQHRVLILVNYRPSEIHGSALPPAARQLTLEPLGAVETDAVARGVLGARELPRGLREFLYERTLGNPFFVEEVCRSLLDEGVLVAGQDTLELARPLHELSTPPTIQSIVRTRIDRLGPRHRQALRLASVIGNEFSIELLDGLIRAQHDRRGEARSRAESTPPPPLDRSELIHVLAELEALGLVQLLETSSGASYRFKHAITQEVSYETIPIDQRRAHHGHVAESIERATDKLGREIQHETLAHHYGLSSRREKAIEYALLAADKAWRAFSPRQAERQYRRAIGLIDSTRAMADELKRLRIDVSLSWVRVGLYNPAQEQADALRTSHALAEEIGYTRGACLCLNWLGWVEQGIGNLSRAIEYSQGFLDAASSLHDQALVSQALTNLGLNHSFAGDYETAIDCLTRGLAMRGRLAGAAYRYAQGQLAMIVADRGDFARAHTLIDQALGSVTEVGMVTMQAPLLVQRAMIEAWQGSFEACLETARCANEIAERIEARYIYGMSLFLEGYGRFMAYREPRGLALMREAVGLLDESEMRLMLSFCLGLLAEALALAGELDGALECAQRALARVEQGDQFGEISAHRVAAVVAGRRGRADEMERHLRRALELCETRFAPRELAITEYRAAELLAQLRPDEAEGRLERALAKFEELGMTGYPAKLRALRSRLERELEL
jgi:class 3 adenylate cyclase/tetratricopeptide (TPR) repeat protein